MTVDDADLTQARTEVFERLLIEHGRKPTGPAATGRCLWCNEILATGLRWCDADCRDTWQRFQP